MHDASPGRSAFLAQAHRSNWQSYLDSLKPDARAGWDVCVLTASDERQASIYRRQLDWRRETGLLPALTRFVVIADPDGQRIGSGGATLRVLESLADSEQIEETFAQQRVLLIHSGGDSRRLPHASATGKIFSRVPRVLPDGRASTLFDEFLISLGGLVRDVPAGVLVASGDVLLVFDPLQLSFRRQGAIGVAAAAPAEMGTHHGVYVSAPEGHGVQAYLHKPSEAALARWEAVHDDGTVQIDTGLVWLDAGMAGQLLEASREDAVSGLPPGMALNLYGDLLLPLAGSTTLDGYLADESDGPATPEIRTARQAIWDRLRGTPLTVERLQPAVFVHFGTSREYLDVVADPDLAETCGWTPHAASWLASGGIDDDLYSTRPPQGTIWPLAERTRSVSLSACSAEGGTGVSKGRAGEAREAKNRTDASQKNPLFLINSSLEGPIDLTSDPVLIVDSHLCGPVTCHGSTLIAGLHTAEPLDIPDGTVLNQLPIDAGFVTRIYGLGDDPKRTLRDSGATYLNGPWEVWLGKAGLDSEDVWPGLPADERALWNAALFPVAQDREESLRLAMPLLDPAQAGGDVCDRWRAAERLSLAESYARAHGERLLADLMAVEDQVACRRFLAAVEAERPAEETKGLLGTVQTVLQRCVGRVGEWLAEAEPTLRMRGYEALTVASGDPFWEDRAFDTLAEMIETDVRRTRSAGSDTGDRSEASAEAEAVRVEAVARSGAVARADIGARNEPAARIETAARIDFGGGWTDTPPYSIERGGTVLNAAVTLRGAYPIAAEADWLEERKLVLESRDIEAEIEPRLAGDVLDHANPADPFGLHKAALVLAGIVSEDCDPGLPVADALGEWGGGIRLSTQTSIPRGSGLGTSSIMAGAVLECLNRLLGRGMSQAQLFDDVLCLEQMMTTGGGWQDQVGGLTGGIKLVSSDPGLPQRISIEPLQLEPETESQLAERLVMVYTGQQRLAKNLLRSVMGRWMARDPEMVWIQQEIARLARAMRGALASDDLDGFGGLLSEHWALNKQMDPGCTNDFIDGLFEILSPYVCGGKLAGAGGGGFAFAVTRDRDAARSLERTLSQRYPGTPVGVWPCAIPDAVL